MPDAASPSLPIEPGDILRDELHAQVRRSIVEAEVPEVFVEVAECRRRARSARSRPLVPVRSSRHHGIAGGIVVASDIETA